MIIKIFTKLQHKSACRLIPVILLFITSLNLFSQKLTLDSCQSLAKNNYPALAKYDIIEKTKEFNLQNANRNYLPKFEVNARASWQTDVTKIDLTMPEGMPPLDIPSIDKDQYRVWAEVNQLVWDGGQVRSAKKQIDAGARVGKEKLDSEIYALRKRVNDIYFGILLLDERIKQQEILEQELERNYKNIESYISAGTANGSDLKIVKVELLQAGQQRIALEATRQSFMEALSVMIGQDINSKTSFEKPKPIEFQNRLNINRPELRLFSAQEELLQSQLSRINADNMPIIALFAQGGYGKPGLNMFNNEFEPYFVGGITLSWNFANLYTAGNNRRKIGLQQRLVESEKNSFLYNLNLQIPQQKIDVDRYKQMMQSDDEIIKLRTEIREVAELRVQNGTMTVTDLMKEIHAEDAAKQARALNEIEYLKSIYNLKYSTN